MMLQHPPSLGHPKLFHPLRTINRRNRNPFALGFGSRNGFRPSTIRCGSEEEEEDGYYMRRCVELARRAVGCTSPNPMVGCVIVKDRVVVGEGFHPKAGQPHAEVFALRDAGDVAESATAYVSLEPCNHYGRTPPCTEALIRAKVKRVVVGMVDPNPIVASKGVERLRDSGIEVTVGVEEILCKKLNEAYIHKMLTGKPFVTLRYSLSINCMIPNELGKGAEEPGGYYSQLLQEYDGIVISSNSSLITSAKFPTSQEDGANQPILIIVPESTNSTFNLPVLPTDIGSRTTVFLNKDTQIDPQTENLIKQQGLESFHSDKLTLSALLDYCSSRGMCSILFDLRSADDCDWLIQEGLEEKLLKKVVLEVCPNFGEGKRETLINLGRNNVNVKDLQSKIVKETYLIEGYIP